VRRQRLEEALRRSHDELEVRVRERTSDLQRTNEQLEVEIAEHRHAEAALQEGERRYRNIFQTAGVSIWEQDFSQVEAAIEELKARHPSGIRAVSWGSANVASSAARNPDPSPANHAEARMQARKARWDKWRALSATTVGSIRWPKISSNTATAMQAGASAYRRAVDPSGRYTHATDLANSATSRPHRWRGAPPDGRPPWRRRPVG
jgi:hypothetical protein